MPDMQPMDDSPWQHLFNLVAGALVTIGLWLMRVTNSRLDQVQRDLDAHKLDVARNYVTSEDLLERLNEIKAQLTRIDQKLDRR